METQPVRAVGPPADPVGVNWDVVACFSDQRDPRTVERQVETVVGQRIFGLVLG